MKIRKNCLLVTGAVVIMLLMTTAAALADLAADGRSVCSKCSDAIVRVQIVTSRTSSYGGESRSRDGKNEVVGTVIDPSGLTVASLACADPDNSGQDESDPDYQVTSVLKDVKLTLADGKEIPAKVVLRDRDLDLIFIRPVTKPATPMAYIDLNNSSKADILDQALIITRLGKVANRTVSACVERIQSVVEKPRKFYTISMSSMGDEYGSPVFKLDGKIIGIVLYREMPGQSDYDDNWLPVVVPAEDILPVAAQAPEDAPKEPAKPAQPEDSK